MTVFKGYMKIIGQNRMLNTADMSADLFSRCTHLHFSPQRESQKQVIRRKRHESLELSMRIGAKSCRVSDRVSWYNLQCI